jgi:hypothetical protein
MLFRKAMLYFCTKQRLHYNHGLLVVSSKVDHCNLFCPVIQTSNTFQISAKFKSCDLGYLLVQNLLSFPPGWEYQLGKLVAIEEYTCLLRVPGRVVEFVPPF